MTRHVGRRSKSTTIGGSNGVIGFKSQGLARVLSVVLGMTAIGLPLTASPAQAGSESTTIDAWESHRNSLVERTREFVKERGSVYAASNSVSASAVGDCGEASVTDPDEGRAIDIGLAAAFANCDGTLSAAVLTYDEWDDSELSSFIVDLDTDRNPATGCQGTDYLIVIVEDGGQFPGAVYRETASCDASEPVDPAFGGRTSDATFIGVTWDETSIGSPSSFAFRLATSSVYTDSFDVAPNQGMAQPVLDITGGGTPPPASRPIAPACTFPGGFEDGFADVPASNPHEAAIDCIVYWQVTTGKTPDIYDPSGGVTRGQMASFLARFVERSGGTLPSNPSDAFPDDNGTTHEVSINKLAAVGIVGGRVDGTYQPRGTVSRAQMATFMIRALEFRLGGPVNDGEPAPNYFTDDHGDTHEANINKAAAIGITGGTGGTNYGPRQGVRRDQMGSFLARGLAELVDAGVTSTPGSPT